MKDGMNYLSFPRSAWERLPDALRPNIFTFYILHYELFYLWHTRQRVGP